MSKLQKTVSRLGTRELTRYIGEDTVSLLEDLDIKAFTPSRLAELLIKQEGPDSLLMDKKFRDKLIKALHEDDALHLCRAIGIDENNPWSNLLSITFKKNSESLKNLYTFFGFSPPESLEETKPVKENIVPYHSLFDHQRKAYQDTLNALLSVPCRALLHMPTGSGKTRTCMQVISEAMRRNTKKDGVVLWLAHNEELCEQAVQEFMKTWKVHGTHELNIYRQFGRYRSNLSEVRNAFIVGSLQLLYLNSLNSQSDFLDLKKRIVLIVVDEAHQSIAPTYKHLLNLLAPNEKTPVLGLTATPGRSWLDIEEDEKLANFYARKKITLNASGYESPIEYLQAEGYLAEVEYDRIEYNPSSINLSTREIESIKSGFDIPTRILSELSKDKIRNINIISRIIDEASNDKKILVFACSVEHAIMLSNILQLKSYKAASITGQTNLSRRRELIQMYKNDDIQILTNFGILTTGFDDPQTNVAVIARPTSSVVLHSQMIGRAIRGPKANGTAHAKIITVVDNIPGFRTIQEGFEYWEELWN